METKLYAVRYANGYLYLFEGEPKKSGRNFMSNVSSDCRMACKEMLPVVRYDNSPVKLVIDPVVDGSIYDSIWVARSVEGKVYLFCEKPDMVDGGIMTSKPSMQWTGSDIFPEITYENSPVRMRIEGSIL
jgi:hypothetical protein